MEIKFRVIDKGGKVVGYEKMFPQDISNTNYDWARSVNGSDWEPGTIQWKNLTREMFTGILDVNNKEIYSGDIVKRGCMDENCNLEHRGEVLYSTKWAMWGINDKTQDRTQWDYPAPLVWGMMGKTMGVEIVGHRLTNPELL